MSHWRIDRIQCQRIRYVRGLYLLKTKCCLNEVHRYDFMLDTGASISVINPEVAKNLGVSKPIYHLPIMSLTGEKDKCPVFYVNMKVGGCEVSDLKVSVKTIDEGFKVPGIIGINFLNKFRTTFEFDNDTLVLRIKK
ncbi:MAG: hypothetical protein GY795_10510 [Desulfobacterales bacterium]|nr:hypothetical protein [Desulfobacterales bacterium]